MTRLRRRCPTCRATRAQLAGGLAQPLCRAADRCRKNAGCDVGSRGRRRWRVPCTMAAQTHAHAPSIHRSRELVPRRRTRRRLLIVRPAGGRRTHRRHRAGLHVRGLGPDQRRRHRLYRLRTRFEPGEPGPRRQIQRRRARRRRTSFSQRPRLDHDSCRLLERGRHLPRDELRRRRLSSHGDAVVRHPCSRRLQWRQARRHPLGGRIRLEFSAHRLLARGWLIQHRELVPTGARIARAGRHLRARQSDRGRRRERRWDEGPRLRGRTRRRRGLRRVFVRRRPFQSREVLGAKLFRVRAPGRRSGRRRLQQRRAR